MNTTIKTVLLTILTLSVFAIALVELSGVSQTALLNKFNGTGAIPAEGKLSSEELMKRDQMVKKMRKTTMEVDTTRYSFGTVKEGTKVRHTWVVKNTGTEPLMISNINVSCGCTAPYFSKDPILPGKQDEITLTFNSAGKSGHVSKNAQIIANVENSPFPIGFEADVEK